MSEPALWAIAYDISDDRSRRRLHAALRKLALPVEYSLFDCPIESAWLGRIATAVQPHVDAGTDRLLLARLASGAGVESLGAAPLISAVSNCLLVRPRRLAA